VEKICLGVGLQARNIFAFSFCSGPEETKTKTGKDPQRPWSFGSDLTECCILKELVVSEEATAAVFPFLY
jgi:hypothetical protein